MLYNCNNNNNKYISFPSTRHFTCIWHYSQCLSRINKSRRRRRGKTENEVFPCRMLSTTWFNLIVNNFVASEYLPLVAACQLHRQCDLIFLLIIPIATTWSEYNYRTTANRLSSHQIVKLFFFTFLSMTISVEVEHFSSFGAGIVVRSLA